MAVNLTVILGAGAAVDVVSPTSQQVKNANFRPPTTGTLFNTPQPWASNYTLFPGVASVVEELRQSLPKKPTSLNVEEFLKNLKCSKDAHRNAQFLEFPLYLQHYFNAVSNNYCLIPSNYATLINKIFDLTPEKVAFVTTNYDLLFDKALDYNDATHFSINNFNMAKYINSKNWLYIKIHGSIDWGRRLKKEGAKSKGSGLKTLIENVKQLGNSLEDALEKEIIIGHMPSLETREMIYPAISVPVGEIKLNCPLEQIQALEEHLNNCQHFLIIGFSGYDKDILNFLDKKEGGFGKVLFVSESKQSATDALLKFFSFGTLGQKLQGHASVSDKNGFDEFVRSYDVLDGLDAYLKHLFV